MIKIIIPEDELFNAKTNEFIKCPQVILHLEHSLLSVHKWEAKNHKPFYDKNCNRSSVEALEYIRCMTIKPSDLPIETYKRLTASQIDEIFKYVDDPMTATTFSSINGESISNNGSYVSAELIYYWMISLGIPIEFEKRHINQLITLIKVISCKSNNQSKMSPQDAAERRKKLNAKRRAKYNTRG